MYLRFTARKETQTKVLKQSKTCQALIQIPESKPIITQEVKSQSPSLISHGSCHSQSSLSSLGKIQVLLPLIADCDLIMRNVVAKE